jgi:hypothetical protein
MSRTFVLAVAGVMWAVVAVDVAVNLWLGEYVFPAVAGLGFAGWVWLFRHHYAQVAAHAET